jgi:hypothetical protein
MAGSDGRCHGTDRQSRLAALMAQPTTDQLSGLGREIREAQDKLLTVERRLIFQTDDSAPLFGAMGAFAGAQYRIVETMQGLVETARPAQPPAFSEQQVDELAKRLAQSCAAWSSGLVQAANHRSAALMLATVFGAALVGGVASWLAFGMPLDPVCIMTQGGGKICGEWTIPERTR